MNNKQRVFYRVMPDRSFSTMEANSLDDAKKLLHDFGECTGIDATNENRIFWSKQRDKSIIVKVTEIIEEIN